MGTAIPTRRHQYGTMTKADELQQLFSVDRAAPGGNPRHIATLAIATQTTAVHASRKDREPERSRRLVDLRPPRRAAGYRPPAAFGCGSVVTSPGGGAEIDTGAPKWVKSMVTVTGAPDSFVLVVVRTK